MKSFRRWLDLLLLAGWMMFLGLCVHAQNAGMLGQSITWRAVQAPFTPDSNSRAIVGGPGADPNPGTPMYICRAQIQGSVIPGKWVQGNCNLPYGGSEQIMRSYDVAYGSARWRQYQGNVYGLAQTGNTAEGNPLYSCRVRYSPNPGVDYGYQPGKLVSDGTCHIPMGGSEIVENPPFEVLYATGGGRPPYPYPYPYPYPPPPPTPPVQPYPPCRPGDPTVKREIQGGTGWWVGPRCSSSDNFGNVQPKYPQPGDDTPPPPYDPGPSSVTWQAAQTPFVPGDNAVKGGPGNGPKPNSPLYVCRVYSNDALLPGKWVQGECNFANDAGKEESSKTYEVANGTAEWRNFDGNIGALVPGGYLFDGTHIYICRKQISYFGGKKGYQPGYLANGKCHVPYGVDNVEGPPFEALYNVFPAQPQVSQGEQNASAPAAVSDAAQPHGILISFQAGTSTTAGTVTVTNGSTNTSVSKPLPPNSTIPQCIEIVQQAAFQAGLQIQAQSDGSGLRVFGINNAVNITQASVSVSQF